MDITCTIALFAQNDYIGVVIKKSILKWNFKGDHYLLIECLVLLISSCSSDSNSDVDEEEEITEVNLVLK